MKLVSFFVIMKLSNKSYVFLFNYEGVRVKNLLIGSGKKIKVVIFYLFFLYVGLESQAQGKYWVYLKDKDTSGFNPYSYFDSKAIQRRLEMKLPLYGFSDIPVNPVYISILRKSLTTIGFQSRWLNAIVVEATESQLAVIKSYSFVKDIKSVRTLELSEASVNIGDSLSGDEQGVLEKQLSIMKGEEFIQHGITGKGIRIAVFDGGFAGLDKSPLFRHLFENGQIIKTYDFVTKREFVYDYMTHGTKVMSCLAGIYHNQSLGLATGAEYLLARTEIKPERHIEEQYWLQAMEWADKNGADIISSSIGYTNKLYPIESMDGKTSIIAKAAKIAAARGILVINAMGNDGNGSWEIMGTPADVDSVLSVGGVNPYTGFHVDFSSFGPTADKRLKPNVCASGIAITAEGNHVGKSYGTSFSTPLIAGFAACVWQMNRQLKNMQIFELIEKSGHLFPYYDYAHGYGIPQASYFFAKATVEIPSSFEVSIVNDTLHIIVSDLNVRAANPEDFLYYHIEDAKGFLKHYAVIKVNQPDVFQFPVNHMKSGDKALFFYKNCIKQYVR